MFGRAALLFYDLNIPDESCMIHIFKDKMMFDVTLTPSVKTSSNGRVIYANSVTKHTGGHLPPNTRIQYQFNSQSR